MGESADEARIQRLVQERMRTIEEEITERVSLSFEVQLAKLEDRLAGRIRTNTAGGTSQMNDTSGDIEFPNGLFEPTKKRKRTSSVGQENKEEAVRRLENTLHETRQLVTFLMNKVAAMESHLVALNDTQRKVKELDAIVVKHKTAMVQIRDYICEHQDFIDSLTKSLNIITGKPLEDVNSIETYHIGVIDTILAQTSQERMVAQTHRETVDKALRQMAAWGHDKQGERAAFEQQAMQPRSSQSREPSLTSFLQTGSAERRDSHSPISSLAAANMHRDQRDPPPVLLQGAPDVAMPNSQSASHRAPHERQSPVLNSGSAKFRAVRAED